MDISSTDISLLWYVTYSPIKYIYIFFWKMHVFCFIVLLWEPVNSRLESKAQNDSNHVLPRWNFLTAYLFIWNRFVIFIGPLVYAGIYIFLILSDSYNWTVSQLLSLQWYGSFIRWSAICFCFCNVLNIFLKSSTQ